MKISGISQNNYNCAFNARKFPKRDFSEEERVLDNNVEECEKESLTDYFDKGYNRLSIVTDYDAYRDKDYFYTREELQQREYDPGSYDYLADNN